MESTKQAKLLAELDKVKNYPTLVAVELTETIVEDKMEKVLTQLEKMEHKLDARLDSLNVKYNVLLGMISFLLVAVTVVTVVTQLKN